MNFGPPASGAGIAVGSTRTADVVVGDPGDAERPSAPARPANRTESTGPRVGVERVCCLAFELGHGLLLGADGWHAPMTSRHRSRATLVGVTSGSHARPAEAAEPQRASRGVVGCWRVGTPLVVLLCGALFVVSADNSEGTDLRPGPLHRPRRAGRAARPTVRRAAGAGRRPQRRGRQLTARRRATGTSSRFQRRIEELEDPAGLDPRAAARASR